MFRAAYATENLCKNVVFLFLIKAKSHRPIVLAYAAVR